MPEPDPISRRATAPALVVALGILAGLAFRQDGWRVGDAFVETSYDASHALSRSPLPDATRWPVVLVYLDLHSFLTAKQDPNLPWPRGLHAQLVDRLTAAGAKAVVFDIVFGGPGPDAEDDARFAKAIRESGRVILAGQVNAGGTHPADPSRPAGRWLDLEPPYSLLATQAVAWGLANHRVDDDLVVRRFFTGLTSLSAPSLPWAVAQRFAPPATPHPASEQQAQSRWLRYYGPPLTIPSVSYVQALEPEAVPDEFFRNRLVVIGARPMAGLFGQRQDEFRSPYHSWTHKERFLAGAEVHATALLNLVRGDSLVRLPPSWERLLVLLSGILIAPALLACRPAGATVVAGAVSATALLLSQAAFSRGFWFPWLAVSAGQIPICLFGSWLLQFRDWFETRRRLEQERRTAEARIREQAALIDKANDAILVRDLTGRVLYANPGAERLYGWTAEELRAGTCPLSQADSDEGFTARTQTCQTGEWHGTLHARDSRGRQRIIDSRWTLIRDELGTPRKLLEIATDVTETRQLEAESNRLQRAEAVGALASGMAHDLNNALAPVLMGTQILARQSSNEESRRILRWMEAGARRSADMVRQVLLFARGRTDDAGPLDPGQLLRELERLARETFPHSIRITTSITPDLWRVHGHTTELHQVLLNLCVNARDAMPDGGSLSLEADHATLDAAAADRIPGGRPGEYVLLSVSDTGTGIAPEVLTRIFEPFFTTKPSGVGTGLGLSTTARIVKAHGGLLNVSSTLGEGTTFEVYLPRLQNDTAATPGHDEEPEPRGNGECLLVADDDLAVLELLRRGLEDHGYRVLAAPNCLEAASLVAAHAPAIQLIVCDAGLLDSVGSDSLRQIRDQHRNLPWLLMAGSAEVEATPSSGDGRTETLAKPVSLGSLLRRVHAIARSQSASAAQPHRAPPTPESTE